MKSRPLGGGGFPRWRCRRCCSCLVFTLFYNRCFCCAASSLVDLLLFCVLLLFCDLLLLFVFCFCVLFLQLCCSFVLSLLLLFLLLFCFVLCFVLCSKKKETPRQALALALGFGLGAGPASCRSVLFCCFGCCCFVGRCASCASWSCCCDSLLLALVAAAPLLRTIVDRACRFATSLSGPGPGAGPASCRSVLFCCFGCCCFGCFLVQLKSPPGSGPGGLFLVAVGVGYSSGLRPS